jgi:uncharacterized protein YbjT (DUF2867 family)
MDLVVGATGQVGRQAALRLRKMGRTVRAMVRGGAARAEARDLVGAGIEVMDGDLTRPDTLAAACRGIETVLTTATSMPQAKDDGLRRVDREGTLALVEVAEKAGVRKFIYTSYSGNIQTPSPLGEAKRAVETRLGNSGMQAVILRPSYFMEVWLGPALGFDPRKGAARIYGSGEAPVSYIAASDVAEWLAALAAHEDKRVTLDVGGPEALSQLDAVRVFEEVLTKPFQREFVPVAALEQMARSPDPLQQSFAGLMIAYAGGDAMPLAPPLAERYGIRLHSVREYAKGFSAG